MKEVQTIWGFVSFSNKSRSKNIIKMITHLLSRLGNNLEGLVTRLVTT